LAQKEFYSEPIAAPLKGLGWNPKASELDGNTLISLMLGRDLKIFMEPKFQAGLGSAESKLTPKRLVWRKPC
jgi:hypothetical protein